MSHDGVTLIKLLLIYLGGWHRRNIQSSLCRLLNKENTVRFKRGEVRKHRATKEVQAWPSRISGPLFKQLVISSDLKHLANTYSKKWAISPPHLRFLFLQHDLQTKWIVISSSTHSQWWSRNFSGLLGDLHCWHLSWFSFNLKEHFNYRTQASKTFNSCP